ncbi:hypothetical protein P7266_0711 [Lactococcus cremoris]|nr:hypothetical protein P7266_0711 [Lactococcus cremoris]
MRIFSLTCLSIAKIITKKRRLTNFIRFHHFLTDHLLTELSVNLTLLFHEEGAYTGCQRLFFSLLFHLKPS